MCVKANVRNQNKIIIQLNSYLKLKQPELADYVPIKHGLCNGFSILQQAMRFADKEYWLEDAINALLKTEINDDNLKQQIKLPQQEQFTTFEKLCERLCQYVLFHQATSDGISGLTQQSILSPGSLFELEAHGRCYRIEHSQAIAGHFVGPDVLAACLPGELFRKDTLCVIGSLDHACSLSFNNDYWYFFDPNSTAGKAKSYASFTELHAAILSSLGPAISIKLSYLSPEPPPPSPDFSAILRPEQQAELLKGNGAAILAHDAPEKLLAFFPLPAEVIHFQRVESHNNLLIYAAESRCTLLAEKLLDQEPDLLDRGNSQQLTPLMAATASHDTAMVELLVRRGANVNATDIDGDTAFILAARHRQWGVAQSLLEAGADINAANKKGETALDIALDDHLPHIALALIAHGASIRDAKKIQCLKLAMRHQHRIATAKLSSHPRMVAVTEENSEEVKREIGVCEAKSISSGHSRTTVVARTITIDQLGNNELMLAAGEGDLARVRALVASDHPLDFSNKFNKTAIDIAQETQHFAIVRYLYEAGATVLDKDLPYLLSTWLNHEPATANAMITDQLEHFDNRYISPLLKNPHLASHHIEYFLDQLGTLQFFQINRFCCQVPRFTAVQLSRIFDCVLNRSDEYAFAPAYSQFALNCERLDGTQRVRLLERINRIHDVHALQHFLDSIETLPKATIVQLTMRQSDLTAAQKQRLLCASLKNQYFTAFRKLTSPEGEHTYPEAEIIYLAARMLLEYSNIVVTFEVIRLLLDHPVEQLQLAKMALYLSHEGHTAHGTAVIMRDLEGMGTALTVPAIRHAYSHGIKRQGHGLFCCLKNFRDKKLLGRIDAYSQEDVTRTVRLLKSRR